VTPAIDSPTASLAIAFAIGIGFGWLLERAGLGSARTLVGQFYFSNLTVVKVLFTALVTAMLGAFWLDRLGGLDLGAVYVPETFVVPQAVGGLLFGGGLLLAGLCPGTSCVALATGRADGLAVMAGLVLGILVFNAGFEGWRPLYESTALGTLTLPDVLRLPAGVVVAVVATLAVLMFAVAERLMRRTQP
jgi:uncharacterized protein